MIKMIEMIDFRERNNRERIGKDGSEMIEVTES